MQELIVEKRIRTLQVKFVKIPGRAGLQIKLVAIGRAEIKRHSRLRRLRWLRHRCKRGIESEVRRQHKRAAVISVVSKKQIGHRRLRRRSFQRWMRVDDARRSVKPRIR